MTERENALFQEFNRNFYQLLEKYDLLQKENELLKSNLSAAEEINDILMERVHEYEERFKNQKDALALISQSEDEGAVKKRIGQMIRTLDRCITLMDK